MKNKNQKPLVRTKESQRPERGKGALSMTKPLWSKPVIDTYPKSQCWISVELWDTRLSPSFGGYLEMGFLYMPELRRDFQRFKPEIEKYPWPGTWFRGMLPILDDGWEKSHRRKISGDLPCENLSLRRH